MRRILNLFSNIIWILVGGIWLALTWLTIGALLCLTVVGIPFGIQCFKIAALAFAPYGKKVTLHFKAHPVANTLWVILGGWEMALLHLAVGVINCLTIVGISRGIQCFKITKLAFFPFGAKLK